MAEEFIASAKLKEWPQEAHNAFVAKVLKNELGLDETQVDGLMELQMALPSLTANASAFRQKLQGKEWGHLLPEAPKGPAGGLVNRYKGLV